MKVIPSDKIIGRFVIANEDGSVVDDANGYGYTSFANAIRAMNYKFKGGKKRQKTMNSWWKKHKELAKHITECYEINAKDIVKGFVTENQIFEDAKRVATEKGIEGFDKKMFNFFVNNKMKL